MNKVGILVLASALAGSAGIQAASSQSLKDLENMPAKQVFDYCAPLWKLWDGIGPLETAEQQDVAARCFYYFGSVVMNWCEGRGQEDALPIKKFVLFWKGFIESEPKAAAAALKPTVVGALVGANLCEKPSQAPAKGKPKRTG